MKKELKEVTKKMEKTFTDAVAEAKEEELRAEVIGYLSVISEHWDEDISQSLMVSPFRYNDVFELCLDGIEQWVKALRILEQLRKGSE